MVEKALDGELTHHLGYPKYSSSKSDSFRNGKSKNGSLTEHGRMEIVSPRDSNGSFESELVNKRKARFDGFVDKVLSIYVRGKKVREVQGHLEDIYAVEISPTMEESFESVCDSIP